MHIILYIYIYPRTRICLSYPVETAKLTRQICTRKCVLTQINKIPVLDLEGFWAAAEVGDNGGAEEAEVEA